MEKENFENFKSSIKEFVALDDQIKEAQKDLKKIRQRHKELKADLMDYMHHNEIGTCTILGGTEQLSLNYRQSKVKPKKEDVEQKMCKFLKMSSNDAEKLYGYLFEATEVKESKVLQRKLTELGRKKKKEEEGDEEEEEDERKHIVI
jgi:hypothetical protein